MTVRKKAASASAAVAANPEQDRVEREELSLLSEEMIDRVAKHSGKAAARKLRDLSRAREVLRVVPERERVLRELAFAAGEPDVWQWAAKLILSTTRSVGAWLDDFVIREWSSVAVAQRIVIYAWPTDFPPFEPRDHFDASTWTPKRYRNAIREYIALVPDDPDDAFTPKDRAQIHALAAHALVPDGRQARKVGAELARRWGSAQSRGNTMMSPWMIDAM